MHTHLLRTLYLPAAAERTTGAATNDLNSGPRDCAVMTSIAIETPRAANDDEVYQLGGCAGI